MKRVAIIGAGVTGLTAAHALQKAGHHPVVFEKSRGLGGRIATRRIGEDIAFDHGAQYLTARTDDFKSVIEEAVRSGAASRWSPRAAGPDGANAPDLFVGTPTMNAFLKAPVNEAGVDVRMQTEIAAVERDGAAWRIQDKAGHLDATFDAVICTVPPPQARVLFTSQQDLMDQIASVHVRPCWTLMLHFDGRIEAPFDTWRDARGDIVWLARNTAKPGRPDVGDAWIAHAGPDWSEAHLEWDRDEIVVALRPIFAKIIGSGLPEPRYASAHRWRYALTEVPLGRPFAANAEGTAYLGGDWALGARVEYAFESGRAMAAAVLEVT